MLRFVSGLAAIGNVSLRQKTGPLVRIISAIAIGGHAIHPAAKNTTQVIACLANAAWRRVNLGCDRIIPMTPSFGYRLRSFPSFVP
jgi:hypothetical protein